VDSRIVSGQIKERVRPLLRDSGFSRFTERNAWRYVDDIVHVLNFQSFNSYNAELIGVTTYSFSVNLGIYFSKIPPTHGDPPSTTRGSRKPHEYECHLRGLLNRTFLQPELDRRDIWYIDPQANYLKLAIDDVVAQLHSAEVQWFQRYSDLQATLELLLSPTMDDPMGPVWGLGNPGSPMRNYKTGYIARALGRRDLACEFLTRAASHFRTNERLAADVKECDAEA
jgi:hypothetical protein